MRLKLGFLSVALVFLGACAPTQLGAWPSAPLEMSSDILKSTKLKPGATWYVSRLYNNTYLGISRDDMNSHFNSS
ncbi:MAG: hypothetical protein IVW51_11325 [Thermaceae bacterium]|nr:hypothetical protein [Thermaceae bacterium]